MAGLFLPTFLDLGIGLLHMVALRLLLMRRVGMIFALEMLGMVLGALGSLGHDFSRFAEVPGICDDGRELSTLAQARRAKRGTPARAESRPAVSASPSWCPPQDQG
jgi:hypothetical protein